MSEYNTGNPVPSIDPRDLDDNATIFDLLLMQAVPSVPDRFGVLRKTWWQMEQDAAALVSPNVTALAAAVSAANKIFYFTGSGTGAVADFTAQARTFLAASTTALQRTALGLGTAAVAALVTANNDTTAGRAMTVGYGGVGVAVSITDANNAELNGFTYRLNSPYTNGPTAAPYTIEALAYDNERFQRATREGVANPVQFVRKRTGPTTWSAWEGVPTLLSPVFTGTPAGPTPAVGTNTTQLATTAMLQAEIANKRAWTSYTPTVTAASGTWTSAAATGTHMGVFGMRNVEMQLTVTTKGTGITAILTLPVPAHASWIGRTLNARQANGSRKIGHAVIQDANTVFLTDYINAELVESNGTIININGAYREA